MVDFKKIGNILSKSAERVIAHTAESTFQHHVQEFAVNFKPEHIQMVAESGRTFGEVIAGAGFKLGANRNPATKPFTDYLLSLPNERLLELVEGAVSPAHVVMLRRYPDVAQGLIDYIKLVTANS